MTKHARLYANFTFTTGETIFIGIFGSGVSPEPYKSHAVLRPLPHILKPQPVQSNSTCFDNKKQEQCSELDSKAKGEYNLICFGGGLLHKFGVDPA